MSGPQKSIVVNGKFLRAPPTGVHRVAAELADALAALTAENHPAVADLHFALWTPHDGAARARALAMPSRVAGIWTGIPWEQVVLPLIKGRSLLLNLCNIGPVLSRDAVTMIHDVQVYLSPASYSRGFRLWYRLVQPALARRNHMLLTVSEFSRQEIARVGLAPLERIAVIHNGADHVLKEAADPDALTRLGLTRQDYVVALSTTQAHKNIGVLLRAFARMEQAALTLVLVGAATRADFESAGHRVPPNVLFAGRVDDGALRALVENALCLAFPSTTEGFGLPPVEAMLLGCPVIAAPCGALPEICGDAACYVAPDDDAGWVAAMRHLATDKDARNAWIIAGRDRASRFTWRNAALTLARVLTAICEK